MRRRHGFKINLRRKQKSHDKDLLTMRSRVLTEERLKEGPGLSATLVRPQVSAKQADYTRTRFICLHPPSKYQKPKRTCVPAPHYWLSPSFL